MGNVDDDISNDLPRWDARILREIAEPILASPDIRQALTQSESHAETLRKLVVIHSPDLICSSSPEGLTFIQRWELPSFAQRWYQILGICVALLAIPGIIGVTVSTFAAILVAVIMSTITSMYIAKFASILPLEPDEETRNALQREVVGPFLRAQINRILAEQEHSDVMRVTSAPGLAALSDREQLVSTETMRSLARLTRAMSSGSIGLSGPRGVGKTTLLRSLCDPSLRVRDANREVQTNSGDLRILVNAPVQYDTRDFILHLFGKFCETVLGDEQPDEIDSVVNRQPRSRSLMFLGYLLTVLGIGVIAYILLKSKHFLKLNVSEEYLAVGCISLVVGVVILAQQIRLKPFARLFIHNAGINDEAREWLTRIRYMQTLTTGYSGSIRLPVGAQIGTTTTRQLAELQLTLPELVDRYRDFASRAIMSRSSDIFRLETSGYREQLERDTIKAQRRADLMSRTSNVLARSALVSALAGLAGRLSATTNRRAATFRAALNYLERPHSTRPTPRIVIGIDEIDKINAESAERFLNDIKAIFGIPHCLYLVSVSDEALVVFERRVLHGRTVFDSTFDEVLRARELDFESCRHLLRRRIAGMPDALIAFCQVMSGGIPRDLIRMARVIIEACAQGQEGIAELTLSVVMAEVEVFKRSSIVEMSGSDSESSRNDFIEYLVQDDWPGKSVPSVLTAIEGGLTDAPTRLKFWSALYLYATVAEIFGPDLSNTISSLRLYRPDEARCIDRLADARSMISVNGEVGWQSISRFRDARGLRIVKRPQNH